MLRNIFAYWWAKGAMLADIFPYWCAKGAMLREIFAYVHDPNVLRSALGGTVGSMYEEGDAPNV